jgi:phosphoglycerate dehydrogenase-like enzyme
MSVGRELDGRVLGVLGLGNIGGQIARIGLAFGMKLIAWSQSLTPEIPPLRGPPWSPRTSCSGRPTW